MKYLMGVFNNFEKYLAYLFTVVMVLLLFVQVIARYVFSYSIVWTEEVAIICFILSVYTGACMAVTRRQHLKIKIFHNHVKTSTALVLDLISNFIFAVTMFIIGNGMYRVISNLYKYKVMYIAANIPKYFVYATIYIMFYVMIIRLIQDSIRLVKEIKELKA